MKAPHEASASGLPFAATAQPAPPSLVLQGLLLEHGQTPSAPAGAALSPSALAAYRQQLFPNVGPRPTPTTASVRDRAEADTEWLDFEISCADGVGLCSRSRRVLLDLASGYAFSLPCLSWSCPECQHSKWYAAKVFFARGIEAARERGERVRFITLTDGSRGGTMTVAELSASWDDLAKRLRRNERRPRHPGPAPVIGDGPGAVHDVWRAEMTRHRAALAAWHAEMRAWRSYLHEYAMVLEVGTRGERRLHTHVLATGKFIWQPRLVEWATACGFGRVVDIREVKDDESVAAYAAKMAGYLSKAGRTPELLARAGRRLRPVRSSRYWLPGGLRAVEEELRLRRPPSLAPKDWLLIEHAGREGGRRWTRFVLLSEKSAGWQRRPTV